MHNCQWCSKSYTTRGKLKRHVAKYHPDSLQKFIDVVSKCPYCKLHFDSYHKLGAHMVWCKLRDGEELEVLRNKISITSTGRKHTQSAIEKIKTSMRAVVLRNPDSYTASNVSGRTPIIVYNGIKLKGTWEVETAKWLDAQNISWTNVITGIEYEWNNSTHLYYPDFYLPKFNCYIEVKGYERDRDKAKWTSINNLVVLKQKEINKIKDRTLVFNDVWPIS